MRRSMTPLTAWPAFADLMTILAIASLAFAATASRPGLDSELEKAKATIARQKADLRTATFRANALRGQLREAQRKLKDLRGDGTGEGKPSCLRENDQIVPLMTIVVTGEARFLVTLTQLAEHVADVREIPRVLDATQGGRMNQRTLEQYSAAIHAHGDLESTFGGSCRFYVELQPGDVDLLTFVRAEGMLASYFLYSNPGEINAVKRGGD